MSLRLAENPGPHHTRNLTEVEAGRDFCIRALDGPGSERLKDLGFHVDTFVRKISGGRNLVCSISGTRLAISQDLARQVLVSPLS